MYMEESKKINKKKIFKKISIFIKLINFGVLPSLECCTYFFHSCLWVLTSWRNKLNDFDPKQLFRVWFSSNGVLAIKFTLLIIKMTSLIFFMFHLKNYIIAHTILKWKLENHSPWLNFIHILVNFHHLNLVSLHACKILFKRMIGMNLVSKKRNNVNNKEKKKRKTFIFCFHGYTKQLDTSAAIF